MEILIGYQYHAAFWQAAMERTTYRDGGPLTFGCY